jgi:carbamoyl-phosphate synthase large subunit
LINNAKLAVLFTETLQKKFHNSPLPYVEGTNPPEVKVCPLVDSVLILVVARIRSRRGLDPFHRPCIDIT